jgi:hypothetical protein
MADPLETIIQWNMTENQALVYRVGLMYINSYNSMLSGKPRIDYPRTTDPRKSHIFRHCWKMVRETRGILKEEEYHLFVRAQIHVLKSIKTEDGHAHIDAQILCGPKAWNRWKFWKRKYDEVLNKAKPATIKNDPIEDEKIKLIINKDKQFLTKTLKEYTEVNIKKSIEDGSLKKWTNLGNLSFYYVVLSPYVKNNMKDDYFNKDLSVYKNKISEVVTSHFKSVFTNEFK